MRRTYKKSKKIKVSKTRNMIIFTFVTSIIVLSLSLSKFESMRSGTSTGRVAKWDIKLSSNYNSYTLFENNQANSQDYTLTIESESEVSSKYDLEVDGLYKVYSVRLARDGYSVGYSFNNDTLSIQKNNDEILFNTTSSNQTVEVNGHNYKMEKTTSLGKTYFVISNESENKEILELITDSNNGLKAVYKNCREYISAGKYEDTYNLRISTAASELPKECNIKLYALFEQID